MQVDILILEENPDSLNKRANFSEIDKLITSLKDYGVSNPQIVNSISQIQPNVFYLYFIPHRFEEIPIAITRQLVIMNITMSQLHEASIKYQFAAIIRYWYYNDNAPFIFGFSEVGKQLDLYHPDEKDAYDFGEGEIYTLLRPRIVEEKPLVPFLLEYLEVYQKIGLEKKSLFRRNQ